MRALLLHEIVCKSIAGFLWSRNGKVWRRKKKTVLKMSPLTQQQQWWCRQPKRDPFLSTIGKALIFPFVVQKTCFSSFSAAAALSSQLTGFFVFSEVLFWQQKNGTNFLRANSNLFPLVLQVELNDLAQSKEDGPIAPLCWANFIQLYKWQER